MPKQNHTHLLRRTHTKYNTRSHSYTAGFLHELAELYGTVVPFAIGQFSLGKLEGKSEGAPVSHSEVLMYVLKQIAMIASCHACLCQNEPRICIVRKHAYIHALTP